jgi:SAM-dependent methyltransferase
MNYLHSHNNSFFDTYYNWSASNSNLTVEDMKFIIHGDDDYKPDVIPTKINTILKTLNISTILDYGAGLGRNLPLLLNYTDDIDYVDLITYQNKFEKYIDDLKYNNKFYMSEYVPYILEKKYDLIYASVVLQHIVNDVLYEQIVKILAEKSKYLILIQHFKIPIKPILNVYFELIDSEIDSVSFKKENHTWTIYKSKAGEC